MLDTGPKLYPALQGKSQPLRLLLNDFVVPVVQQVYRGTAGKEQDSIIGFYNKVYMVSMKSIILQFAPNKVRQLTTTTIFIRAQKLYSIDLFVYINIIGLLA